MEKDEIRHSPELSVRLVVRGRTVDPARITGAFGVAPTDAHRAGELIAPGELPIRHADGFWKLDSGRPVAAPLPEHVAWLMSTLKCDAGAFRKAVGTNEAELLCTIQPHGPEARAEITPPMSAWLSERNLRLSVNFYNYTPAEAQADLADFFGAVRNARAEPPRST